MTTDGSEPQSSASRRLSRRAVWVIVGASTVAAASIVAIAMVAGLGDGGTPTTAPTASSEPTNSPTATTTPPSSPTGSPSPAPTTNPEGRAELPPISLDSPAEPISGVSVTVTSIESVDGEAVQPGEVAGPALRVVVTFANSTSTALNLSTTVVNLYSGSDLAPANELARPGGSPFPAEVAAGSAGTGTFVFAVPLDRRDFIRITVDNAVDVPIVAFEGAAPQ